MPVFPLKDIFEALDSREPHIQKSSALNRYKSQMGYIGPKADAKVRQEIIAGLRRLNAAHFSESVTIDDYNGRPVRCDVYALIGYKGWDWYVKIRILKDKDGTRLIDVSFHLPDDHIRDPKGKILCRCGDDQERARKLAEEW